MKKIKTLSLFLAIIFVIGGFAQSTMAAVTSKDYTEEELDSSSYDLKKYTSSFWEGNIVYNEVVYPINNSDIPQYYFELMYDATEIISVKDYRLEITYEKGKDYHLVDGNLFIPAKSAIERVDYNFIHPKNAPEGYGEDEFAPYYPTADGKGYEYWVGGPEICSKAICVTYIHNDTWDGPVPASQETELPVTMEKLTSRTDMTVVVAGDSVSTGANASGFLGISPFTDAYPEMTAKALRAKFGYDGIKLVNSAIGGTMSHFNKDKVDSTIINHDPDLVILNFGMNDSSCERVGIPAEEFRNNHIEHIEYIKEKLPDCEILLVSSLYGNRYTFPAERYEEHAAVLRSLAAEYDGVGVADPQTIEKYLMDEVGKDYLCFMADNMVHPGDFGMRLMAQCILAALDVSDIDGYKDELIGMLRAYAKAEDHTDDGKKDELLQIIDKASNDIKYLKSEWDINEIINIAFEDLERILKRCAFEDHVFDNTLVPVTCKDQGYTHSVCTVCGFEYDNSFVAPLGGEHIMDSGRVTRSPTYKDDGIYTYKCAKCGFEENESIPMLNDPPVVETKGMLHISNSYNYMEGRQRPYRKGAGTIELDVCPLDINVEGTPYVGVWFSRYSITACYNFRTQQVEIISTTLPYAGGTPYAYKKVEWTPDSGRFEYNWKKFAVTVEGHTVRIYLDGELVLEDTNDLYSASTEVSLLYSVGEYYFDNIKVAGAGYDPVKGEGEHIGFWDFNTTESHNSFMNNWSNSYSEVTYMKANAKNYSTGLYKNHKHVLTYINTVERTCNSSGYNEYTCDVCGNVIRLDIKEPLYINGHTLCDKYLMYAPTEKYSGRYGYSCENCFAEFTEIIPVGCDYYPVLFGDINNDGKFDHVDMVYADRFIRGYKLDFEVDAFDLDGDGEVTNLDRVLLDRNDRLKNKAS